MKDAPEIPADGDSFGLDSLIDIVKSMDLGNDIILYLKNAWP